MMGWPATVGAEMRYPSATIGWVAPAECPTEAGVAAQIEDFLGQPLDTERERHVEAQVEVSAATDGFVAAISIASERGRVSRQLDHADCVKLAEAVALVVALAIDPEQVQRRKQEVEEAEPRSSGAAAGTSTATFESVPTPSAAPVAAVSTPCPPPSPPPPPPAPTPKMRPVVTARVEVLAGRGALPGWGGGAGGRVGVRPLPWLEIAALGRHWFSRNAEVPGYSDAQARLGLTTSGLVGCWVALTSSIEATACGGAVLGVMTGVGVGVDRSAVFRAGWGAATSQLGLGVPLGNGWTGRLGLEAGLSLSRPRFVVTTREGEATAHRAEAWAARGLLAFEHAVVLTPK